MDYKNQSEQMTWILSKGSNATQFHCRKILDVAFLASYAVAGFAIFIGNLFTCAVFLSKQQLRRTYMNVFLISLAFSDFLMSVLVFPGYTFFCTVCSVAPFSLPRKGRVCGILDGLKDFVFLATVFNVLAITFDRYEAVIQSLKYKTRITKKSVTFILTLVWLVPWPIAYLKQILIYANPSFFQQKNRVSIYDNVVVFIFIIFPMVILLVVNTLLTKAIRGQVAKISIPGNLYSTAEMQQQTERNDRKDDGTAPTFDALQNNVEDNTVKRRDNCKDDDIDTQNQGNVNEGFQGDDEKEMNGNFEESKDHVISESHGYHVTVSSLDLRTPFRSNDNVDFDSSKSNSAEESVNLNSSARKILKTFSHDGVIPEDDHPRDQFYQSHESAGGKLEHKYQLDNDNNNVRTAGESFELKGIKLTRRRKLGCVVQPAENELANKSPPKEAVRGECFSKEADDQSCYVSGKLNSVNEEKEEGLQRKSSSGILRESSTRENSSKEIVNRNFEFSDVKTIQEEEQQQEADEFGEAQSIELSKDSIMDKTATSVGNINPSCDSSKLTTSSGHYNIAVSEPNEDEKKSLNVTIRKSCESCDKATYNEEHQDEKKETISKEKYKSESIKSCLTKDTQNSKKDGADRKSIGFQEQKKVSEKTSKSSLVAKRLKKFSRERKERNGTRSCLTVALIFVLCWIPRCLHNFFLLFAPPDIINIYLLEQTSMLLLFLQSLTNPLVYSVYRSDFRQAAKDLIRKITCRRTNQETFN